MWMAMLISCLLWPMGFGLQVSHAGWNNQHCASATKSLSVNWIRRSHLKLTKVRDSEWLWYDVHDCMFKLLDNIFSSFSKCAARVHLHFVEVELFVDVCFSTILVLCNCSGSWRVLSAEKFRMLTPQPLVGSEKQWNNLWLDVQC